MMDEHLIKEVEKHAIIYNRQKKTIGIKGEEHIGKEYAWVDIATRLQTDVDTCKKRWKYLRERYVQQKKQGDTGHMYEHLSRPYLEKMKFLDRYIQPRKSYRGVISHMGSSLEMADSSKSNCSSTFTLPVMCRLNDITDLHKFEQTIKTEDDMSPINVLTSSQLQDKNSNMQHHHALTTPEHEGNPSLSPSVTSLMSPPPPVKISLSQSANNLNHNNHSNSSTNSDDDDTTITPSIKVANHERNSSMQVSPQFYTNGGGSHGGGSNSGYQHLPFPYNHFNNHYSNLQEQKPLHRTSDELLGELVTTELMKMSGEKKKYVQKKILQILFFED